jgi:hypothetical protein
MEGGLKIMPYESYIGSNIVGLIPRKQASALLTDLIAYPGLHPYTTGLRKNLETDLADTPVQPTHIVLDPHDLAAIAIQGDLTGKLPADYDIRMF